MKVLCLSTNLELALLRSALLRSKGIEVDFPQSKQETLKLIETATYDAALLSIAFQTVRRKNLPQHSEPTKAESVSSA